MEAPEAEQRAKISFTHYGKLWDQLNLKIESLFLRRDQFLDHIISTQLADLRTQMRGKVLSEAGREYIRRKVEETARKFALPERPTTMSLVLRQSTIDLMNKLCEEHNIVRDALLNRIALFLLSPDAFLKRELDIESRLSIGGTSGDSSLPASPLEALKEVMSTSMYFLTCEIVDGDLGTGIYDVMLSEAFHGFECYLPEEQVPGTDAYLARLNQPDPLDAFG